MQVFTNPLEIVYVYVIGPKRHEPNDPVAKFDYKYKEKQPKVIRPWLVVQCISYGNLESSVYIRVLPLVFSVTYHSLPSTSRRIGI